MPTLYPELAPADQLVSSFVDWLNTTARASHADWPTKESMPALVNVRGGTLYLPCIVVGFSGQTEMLPMRGTHEVELQFDLLTENDSADADAMLAAEAFHKRASELLASALQDISKKPGPLDFVYLHELFLEGREHSPKDNWSLTRQNGRAVITLQTKET